MQRELAARYRAPIAYGDIRRLYNAVRALGSVVIAIGSAVAWTLGSASAPFVLSGAVIVLADALWRLRTPTGATTLLFVDSTAIGAALLVRGDTPSAEIAAFIYILTAAMLLLPLRDAALMVGYALAWAVPMALWAPLLTDREPSASLSIATDRLATAVFVAVIAALLYAAGRALYRAAETNTAALREHERALQLKNEFVSMVSHELRTPLTSIAGFTDTLREAWKQLDASEVDEFLAIMRREEEHLSNLVEDILVIPRLEAGQLKLEPEIIDLRSHAFETGEIVFQGSTKDFSVTVPGGVSVHADPVRLRQILRNLLENAKKYGGDQILVEAERSGDHYLVVVSDNGPGIPEGHRERIFEHFEQVSKGDARAEQGVGLGLPIAKTLATAMGGDLWYEERFPTGSRFCFTVRVAAAAAQTQADHHPEPTAA